MTASDTAPQRARSRTAPWRPAMRSSAAARCGVIRAGATPLGRYSTIVRPPPSADDTESVIRNTPATGAT